MDKAFLKEACGEALSGRAQQATSCQCQTKHTQQDMTPNASAGVPQPCSFLINPLTLTQDPSRFMGVALGT